MTDSDTPSLARPAADHLPPAPPRGTIRVPRRVAGRTRFLVKVPIAIGLVAASDYVLNVPTWQIGWGLGGLALVWIVGLVLARPFLLKARPAVVALTVALALAFALIHDPGLMALALFIVALAVATLLPRLAAPLSPPRLALSILFGMMIAPGRPVVDMARWLRLPLFEVRSGVGGFLSLFAMPVIGSAVFVALFADANPVLASFLSEIDPRLFLRDLSAVRVAFWGVVLIAAWALIRPSPLLPIRRWAVSNHPPRPATPAFAASLGLSLVAFNLIFAIQNGLDIAFLWLGRGDGDVLPAGVTYAAYAHRGAYSLIVTALLAAVFVLVTFRPGSNLAADRRLIRLVLVWIAQNVVLVASSADRLSHYVAAYSLTEWRIAAFVWMALVALGLLLIMVRIARRLDNLWLVNANSAAAALVLVGVTYLDLGEIAASWNVAHNREQGTAEAPLDPCYLARLGTSALPALVALDDGQLSEEKRVFVARLRSRLITDLARQQNDVRAWTLRGAFRLHAAYAVGAEKRGVSGGMNYHCDGTLAP